eukprot:s422_g38.t2
MPPNKDDGKSARFPLLFAAQELEKLDPERIPCDSDQTNWGGYKPNHALQQMGKTMYTWARGEEKAQNDLLRLIGGVALNAGDRVDWSLQEDISMWTTVGVAGELMQALPSHSCYMKSPDVAAFIQNHSTKIAVANSLVAKHGPEMFPDASETAHAVPLHRSQGCGGGAKCLRSPTADLTEDQAGLAADGVTSQGRLQGPDGSSGGTTRTMAVPQKPGTDSPLKGVSSGAGKTLGDGTATTLPPIS